jgi:exodeoxyribonuclease VII small subunit
MSNEMVDSSTEKPATGECSFEESLLALEQVVHDLEDGDLGLSESLGRYETGVKHLKQCYQMLEAAERKIELLTGVGEDGKARTEMFEESSESLGESTGRRRRTRKTD